jgi:effector-binding domain-containing protein
MSLILEPESKTETSTVFMYVPFRGKICKIYIKENKFDKDDLGHDVTYSLALVDENGERIPSWEFPKGEELHFLLLASLFHSIEQAAELRLQLDTIMSEENV